MILQEKCSLINNSHDWNNCRKMFPCCSLYFDIWVKCSEINHNSGNNSGKCSPIIYNIWNNLGSVHILFPASSQYWNPKEKQAFFPNKIQNVPQFFPLNGKISPFIPKWESQKVSCVVNYFFAWLISDHFSTRWTSCSFTLLIVAESSSPRSIFTSALCLLLHSRDNSTPTATTKQSGEHLINE